MSIKTPEILYTHVVHRRMAKPVHQLSYRLAYICVDIGKVYTLFPRWSPYSLRLTDYGPDGCTDLEAFVRQEANKKTKASLGSITLVTLPRFLGRGFNPISLFIVHDVAGKPVALVYEVRNTFGEKHHYCTALNQGPQRAAKAFHVSPFLAMDGHYTFNFACEDGLKLAITKSGATGPELYTRMQGRSAPLTRKSLFAASLRFPLQGAIVLAAIHYEALKLVLKRARIYPHPRKSNTLPMNEVTNDS